VLAGGGPAGRWTCAVVSQPEMTKAQQNIAIKRTIIHLRVIAISFNAISLS
jgi:hypothetical protein